MRVLSRVFLILVSCSSERTDDSNADAALDSQSGEVDTAAADGGAVGVCLGPYLPSEDCVAVACEMVNCGAPTSYLDEHLCERRRCVSTEECGPDEKCQELQYYRIRYCGPLEPGGACVCGHHDLNSYDWMCMPSEAAKPGEPE